MKKLRQSELWTSPKNTQLVEIKRQNLNPEQSDARSQGHTYRATRSWEVASGALLGKRRQVYKLISTVPFPEKKKMVSVLWKNQGDITLEGHSQTDPHAYTDRPPHTDPPHKDRHTQTQMHTQTDPTPSLSQGSISLQTHVPYTAPTTSCPFILPSKVT